MIRSLIIGLLIYIGYRVIISLIGTKKTTTRKGSDDSPGVETFRDPVCGVYVSEELAIIGKYNGERHYFCSMSCLEKYREQLDVK